MFYNHKMLKTLSAIAAFILIPGILCSCASGTAGSTETDGADPLDTTKTAETTTAAETLPPEPAPDYNSLKGDWFKADIDVSHLAGKKLVAITVDDGPSESMDKILDTLEELDAPATFFLIGRSINEETAPMLRRAVALGCELGNHSFTHPDLRDIADTKNDGEQIIREELEKTHNAIYEITGIKNYLIRPPYGAASTLSLKYSCAPSVAWTLDAADWNGATVEEAYKNVVEHVFDGGIILTHANPTTVESLKLIIPKLREMGYEPVTVSELAAARGCVMNSTNIYSCFPPIIED